MSRRTLLPPHTTQPEEEKREKERRGEREERREEKGKGRRGGGEGERRKKGRGSYCICFPHSEESYQTVTLPPYLSQFHLLSQPADHTSNSLLPTLKVGVAWGVVNLGQSVVEDKCSGVWEKF